MPRYPYLFLALLGGAACAQALTPTQMMEQSAAAAVQQQQIQQQQMMGHIFDNIARCGDAYGHGCRQPQQEVDNSRPAEWTMTGLEDSYGGIAIAYRNDIILDDYSNPLPFSWEAYRDYTSIIDGMAMHEVSPFGFYSPFRIYRAGTFRNQPGSEADVRAKLREECGEDACIVATVYRNVCNAVAVGWLPDYSGVRIYTARQAHHGNTAYGKGWYGHTDPEERRTAHTMIEAPVADALSRCQSDPAVLAASCTAPPDQAKECALPKKLGEYR
ncbi:hypothetical protein [Cardiobacterium valvarum]|uniref:DUF4189 domain-containing protein n=1 Tax=Cardiobacterium valvarum TaxID=194702 RepID=A0A381E1C2_9GAMM|nr:hypothetical protein [Cardiobacterium valvarum]SUX19565.1 Uncharacterised protein [Cardiobacterium valvarum]